MGLANSPQSLDAALWEMDIRWLQQLHHAEAFLQGAKIKWSHNVGKDKETEQALEKLGSRPFNITQF